MGACEMVLKRGDLFSACLAVFFVVPQVWAYGVEHHGLWAEHDQPRDCLTCHDGTVSQNVECRTTCIAKNPLSVHPNFVRYPPAGKEEVFFSVAEAEAAGINLFEGQVTCIACHDITLKSDKHLVIDNAGSGLCLACHRR